MDKLDVLNAFYHQPKYARFKCCNHSSQRSEVIVRNKRHLHPKMFSIDDNTWTYINLEDYVTEPELLQFVKDYLNKDFKKGKDPSFFVLENWQRKNFITNTFQNFQAVYFPQAPKDFNTYKRVEKK